MQNTTTQWRRATQSFRKIYLSLYLKGLCVRGSWETELNRNILPPSIGHNRVSIPSSWAAQPGTWGPGLSGTCSSIQHLVSNCNYSIGGPRGHSAGCWLTIPHLISNWSVLQNSPISKQVWSPKLTDFLSSPSYIIVQSPTQYLPITGHRNVSLPPSLEWHVWSSLSGNNCHSVHRSLSSGASVCGCTVGF